MQKMCVVEGMGIDNEAVQGLVNNEGLGFVSLDTLLHHGTFTSSLTFCSVAIVLHFNFEFNIIEADDQQWRQSILYEHDTLQGMMAKMVSPSRRTNTGMP
jgi:hypothetical protein